MTMILKNKSDTGSNSNSRFSKCAIYVRKLLLNKTKQIKDNNGNNIQKLFVKT